ncbi:hypothetical protein IQ255_31205 [Pleurocapsales cyanobacterium LEGE 10410]|nr:hypothetical protein [Pleurocapsales cyanobacterium LEGE 10410]
MANRRFFQDGQNYSKMLKIVEPLILLLVCVIRPFQIKKIWECDRLGKVLGKQAECLLIYRFEDNWARPIDDVRAELKLLPNDERLATDKASTPITAKSQKKVTA